jgi:hypothetical protein
MKLFSKIVTTPYPGTIRSRNPYVASVSLVTGVDDMTRPSRFGVIVLQKTSGHLGQDDTNTSACLSNKTILFNLMYVCKNLLKADNKYF